MLFGSVIICIFCSFCTKHVVLGNIDSPDNCENGNAEIQNTESAYNYSEYHSFEKIEEELHNIVNKRKEGIKSTLFSIGKTFENRSLWAIKFEAEDAEDAEDTDEGSATKQKKLIVIECGAHAREWISMGTCMYFINVLSQSENEISSKTLEKYNWVIIPVLNPDGYVYTWYNKTTRQWRKNRSFDKMQKLAWKEAQRDICIGVDLNRNFNTSWGTVGTTINNPCNEMYAGSKPFSEKETSALAAYLKSIKTETIAYVSLHCYSQKWMTPWGHTGDRPNQYKEMIRVAKVAVAAMKAFSNVTFQVGSTHSKLYPASGSSTDWVYKNLPTPYTYLVEMAPDKNYLKPSFSFPAGLMVKNARDMEHGLLTMALELKEDVIDL